VVKRRGRQSRPEYTQGGFHGKSLLCWAGHSQEGYSVLIKQPDGAVLEQGQVAATRYALRQWLKTIPEVCKGAMEATLFTGWVYDFLKPHALELKVANPTMLKAITAAKKKNDRADAERLAPECYMAPQAMRDLRRVLRYRSLVVSTATKMKNRISGLLMEGGAESSGP
jgi:transposase